MSTDDIQQKWPALAAGMASIIILPWMAWITLQIIDMKASIQAQTITSANVIPPVVESALVEIRTRLNADQVERTRILQGVIENSKDIGYLQQKK